MTLGAPRTDSLKMTLVAAVDRTLDRSTSTPSSCPCSNGAKCCVSVEISADSMLSECVEQDGKHVCDGACLCNGVACPGYSETTYAFDEVVSTPKKTCCAAEHCELCDLEDPVKIQYCGWISMDDQRPISAYECLGTSEDMPQSPGTCKSECDLATEVEAPGA